MCDSPFYRKNSDVIKGRKSFYLLALISFSYFSIIFLTI